MPTERKPLTQQEWALYDIVGTPSAFTEWTRPYLEGSGFRLWLRQVIEVNREAKRIKRIQGRYLGKSITCASQFVQHCVMWTKPVGVALFATRQESNLEPIFQRELIGQFKRVPFLRMFLQPNDAGVNRKTWTIALRNGVTIRGRIEGKEGAGLQTIHPDVVAWVDEVQMLSDAAVGEFYGMVSAELPMLASGVPNGVRSSWAFKIDTDPSYGFEGGRMTRKDDPRFTEQMDKELQEFYGGPQSSGYLNRVMGEWGADSRMTFDTERIVRDLPLKAGSTAMVRPTFYRSIEIHARDVVNPDGTAKRDVLAMRFSFRGDLPKTTKVWFAADHGQSASPTTLYIHFWDPAVHAWRQYHRVQLFGMEAPTQADVIHWLGEQIHQMSGVKPVIGMDTTGQGGSAVMASLQPLGWELMRVDVREAIPTDDMRLETDEELRKRLAKDPFSPAAKQLVTIYARTRQVAFPRLAREFYAERLRLVNEPDLIKQIESTTDHEGKTGERIYETDFHIDGVPWNHDLSAFEIFGAMLHNLDTREEIKQPDLWVRPFEVPWGSIQ